MKCFTKPCAMRLLLSICLSCLFPAFPAFPEQAKPDWAQRIDERSGLTWETLTEGNVPVDGFWKFIEPQRTYLRETYGPDVSTTYELYLKDLDRTVQPAGKPKAPGLVEIKTLKRWPDPVVIQGRNLPGWTGLEMGKLRLYASHLGKFEPIPYQFDEFTETLVKVLPDGGPEANPQDGNGLLDPQDELVLMAHDLGDRVHPEQWMGGYEEVLEIELEDPLDGGKGWCYLLKFAANPPARSPLNYATYVEKFNQQLGFYIYDQSSFKVVGDELYRQIFPHRARMPDYAGGTFEDFIDRVKYRARIRLFFGRIKVTITEDKFLGDTLAVRDGPVRCTRRCWGQMHLPMGFKTPKIIADIIQMDTAFVNPVELDVPINPGLVLTDLTMFSGTEMSTAAYGSRWYNSNNQQGFQVDGEQTGDEKKMDESPEDWRIVTGRWGTMMNRSLWDPDYKRQAKIRVEFIDNIKKEDPPEYEPGQVGMAYSFTTVRDLTPGLYTMELDWFFIPWFNSLDRVGQLNMATVNAYMDMYDRPLKVRVGPNQFENDPRPKGYHKRKN